MIMPSLDTLKIEMLLLGIGFGRMLSYSYKSFFTLSSAPSRHSRAVKLTNAMDENK